MIIIHQRGSEKATDKLRPFQYHIHHKAFVRLEQRTRHIRTYTESYNIMHAVSNGFITSNVNNHAPCNFGSCNKHRILTDLSDSYNEHIFTPESSPPLDSFKTNSSKSKLILPPLLIGLRKPD
ncbi:hypothetical protein INT48_005392 [Thamnidium elegans]|uniref:Uncharacterized protein n=1 Tax=Thamnidium elegans TaxID=101142 RepID=A0A8H7VWU0_9FUNG|nr:hypothetical protein INT48_005392 [Thamnidium elegans]